MPSRSSKKVLVSIPTAQYAERLKLEGVLRFAHEKRGDRWDVVIDVGGRIGPDISGLIAYVTSDAHRRKMLAAGLPTVLIEDLLEPKSPSRRRNVVTLLCDHEAEGRTAARHFLGRHYRNFAFIGTDAGWSRRRENGFVRTLKDAGFSCPVVDIEDLRSLPKPCAIFAAHDILARRALAAAEEHGIAIPADMAVLGVDDDEVMCTTSAPALSSIPTFDRSLGYAAGRALNELFAGERGGRVIRTRHTQVVTRTSTEKDAVDDPFVARTLDWARQHLSDNLNVAALARRIGCSKSLLQLRVERTLGAPLGEIIRRLRLTEAEDLLAHTDRSIGEIAEQCGFTSASHLSLRLKEACGKTPLAYRHQAKLRPKFRAEFR